MRCEISSCRVFVFILLVFSLILPCAEIHITPSNQILSPVSSFQARVLPAVQGVPPRPTNEWETQLTLDPNDIPCEGRFLAKYFEGDEVMLERLFRQKLPPISLNRIAITLAGHGAHLLVYKRSFITKTGVKIIWAFELKKLRIAARVFGVPLRTTPYIPLIRRIPRLGKDEVGCSRPEFGKVFIGESKKIDQAVKNLVTKIRASSLPGHVLVGIQWIPVFQRRSGRYILWAFSSQYKDIVAQDYDFKVKIALDPPAEDEIACSASGMRELFFGDGTAMAAQLHSRLPKLAGDETFFLLKKNNLEISFYKRLYQAHREWFFKKKEVPKMVSLFGFVPRKYKKMKRTEIACSGPKLARVFRGNEMALYEKINQALPSIDSEGETFSLTKNEVTVIYIKRYQWSHVVWTFRREKIEDVAKQFDLAIREKPLLPRLRDGVVESAVIEASL